MTQTMVRPEMAEYPERVAWYQSLILQVTGHVPQVMEVQPGAVAAWVPPYLSKYGLHHPAPTQAWGESAEQALETLCEWVHLDAEMDEVAWQMQRAGYSLG